MVYHSDLNPQAYLTAMKRCMSGHFEFGTERFTGFFAGSCFYVTHHSEYQWSHRITSQKNAAVGFVKETHDGCEVHFLRFRGLLCPLVFLPFLLVLLALSPFIGGFGTGEDLQAKLLIGLLAAVVSAPVLTLFESMTQASDEGRRKLLSLLKNPADRRANYPYIP